MTLLRIPPWARPRHGRLPGDPEPEQVLVVPEALPPSMTETVPAYTAPPVDEDVRLEPDLPEGVLGYGVGVWSGGEFLGFTHTTALSRESAEDEVACWNKRRDDARTFGAAAACWRVVEVRLP